jgi:hypothetical protein
MDYGVASSLPDLEALDSTVIRVTVADNFKPPSVTERALASVAEAVLPVVPLLTTRVGLAERVEPVVAPLATSYMPFAKDVATTVSAGILKLRALVVEVSL